jgi:transposase
MAMGKRKKHDQQILFVPTASLPRSAAHPFYSKLNQVLADWKFDEFVEGLCGKFYEEKIGRPSLAPGKYFRLLLIGYFEGIDSERGIAWRCSDSLSLRSFVGYRLDEISTEHSTISRTRRLIDLETHREVFQWVLKVLADHDLVGGKTVGYDATTLEANAAMRSIVRKDTQQNYQDFLTDLAKASGIETPTREELAKLDRTRKNKASNDDWENPHDPDAKITKMKDGRTHLAHKAEHAVDMDSGAVLAVTLQGANLGDTTTIMETVIAATENLRSVADDPRTQQKLDENWMSEAVADKGYHSNAAMTDLAEMNIRSYVSEPDRGRRDWEGKPDAQAAVYANRRRIRGNRGQRLMRLRGELIERSFAHNYETGAMRRTHLRHHENIAKRLLVHVGGFNLGLVMRRLIGIGKPRRMQGLHARVFALILSLWRFVAAICSISASESDQDLNPMFALLAAWALLVIRRRQVKTTGC